MKTIKCFLTTAMAIFCSMVLWAQTPDITTGLVAHWPLDNDSTGTVSDISGNAFHASAYNINYGAGAEGQAALFNGSNSRIYVPAYNTAPPAVISQLSTGSIALWFKFLNMGADILPLLYFGESNAANPHNSLIIEIGHAQDAQNRRLYFTIINKGFCYDSGINLNPNTWYHFVAVVSDSGNTGYLNGTELTGRHYNLGSDSTYTDFFADVPTPLILTLGYGRFGQETPFFPYKGALDEVRIYNRPLLAADVQALYQQGFATIVQNEVSGNYFSTPFPNPAADIVYLPKLDNDEVPEKVFLCNMAGQMFMLPTTLQSGLTRISTGTLSDGIYILNIVSANRTVSYPLIIKHR